jgi:hypothetical protein
MPAGGVTAPAVERAKKLPAPRPAWFETRFLAPLTMMEPGSNRGTNDISAPELISTAADSALLEL